MEYLRTQYDRFLEDDRKLGVSIMRTELLSAMIAALPETQVAQQDAIRRQVAASQDAELANVIETMRRIANNTIAPPSSEQKGYIRQVLNAIAEAEDDRISESTRRNARDAAIRLLN